MGHTGQKPPRNGAKMLKTLNGQEEQVIEQEVVTEEKVNAGTQEKEKAPPADTKPSEVELLKQEVEKLKKVTVDRGAHIGKLRTQLSELKSQASQSAKEAHEIKDEHPLEAAGKIFDSKQAEKRAADIEREIEFDEITTSNKQVVLSKFPEFPSMIDDVCKILADDGIDEQAISDFRQHPYATSAGMLINLARAAKSNKENEQLKKRLESASSQTDTILQEIETKANRRTINNISGGGSVGAGTKTFAIDKSVSAMTREEIAQLKQSLRQTG